MDFIIEIIFDDWNLRMKIPFNKSIIYEISKNLYLSGNKSQFIIIFVVVSIGNGVVKIVNE